MDTLVLKALEHLNAAQDSIVLHNQALQEAIGKLKPDNTKWLGLIGVAVGALMGFLGQLAFKIFETRSTTSKAKIECINKLFINIRLLSFYFHNLAYLSVDSNYQWYQSYAENDEVSRKKALDEHYNDYGYITETETKINMAVAEIESGYALFFRLKGKTPPEEDMTQIAVFCEHVSNLKDADMFKNILPPGEVEKMRSVANAAQPMKALREISVDEMKLCIDSLYASYNCYTGSIRSMAEKLKI